MFMQDNLGVRDRGSMYRLQCNIWYTEKQESSIHGAGARSTQRSQQSEHLELLLFLVSDTMCAIVKAATGRI